MTNEIKMLPIRQKQIVDKIKSFGFISDNFTFNPISNDWFELHYKPNNFYYIKIHNNQHVFRPGQKGEKSGHGKTNGWDECVQRVDYWLKGLKENIDVGDPWKEIVDFKNEMHEMKFDSYEEFFNEDEKQKFANKLDLLLTHFESLKIDTTEIKKDMEHLKQMSDKISKKDIILLFLGSITGWIFSDLIPTDTITPVWRHIKTLFSGLKLKLLS